MPERVRQPWGSLTRETIIDAALEVVDRDGLEALSMPRLARHLGTGVMTLYGHVANKADLIDALAERVLAELQTVEGEPGEWSRVLSRHMHHLRQVVLRHPALGAVLSTRSLPTLSVFRELEACLQLLRSAGFDRQTAVQIYYALLTYTLGFLAWEIPRVRRQSAAVYRQQWRSALADLAETEYPALSDLSEQLRDSASDNQFEAGLNALLLGFGPQATGHG
jgi:TetR/AcrR family transcriptional regulator, tetracycline repressor protein